MKKESKKFKDDFDGILEQVDMADIDDDIKNWLIEDTQGLDDKFKNVTREEEYQAVSEAIADEMMER